MAPQRSKTMQFSLKRYALTLAIGVHRYLSRQMMKLSCYDDCQHETFLSCPSTPVSEIELVSKAVVSVNRSRTTDTGFLSFLKVVHSTIPWTWNLKGFNVFI